MPLDASHHYSGGLPDNGGLSRLRVLASALILALAVGTPSALAEDEGPICSTRHRPRDCAERLEAVFSRVFDDERVYTPMACHDNVENLLRRLWAAGFYLNRFRVLYLISVEPDGGEGIRATGAQVHPLQTRDGSKDWTFHAVVEVGGRVIDLDFGQVPRVVPWADYTAAMFGAAPTPEMGVRAIPAPEYIREHDEVIDLDHLPAKNWSYYVYDVEGRYPVAPLAEFR